MWLKKGTFFFITLLFFVTVADATVTDKDIAKCAALEGDLSRLECYDNLAKANNLAGKQIEPTPILEKGKWEVEISKNPIDDTKTVILALVADSGTSKWNKPIVLLVRCQSKYTELFINWGSYLGDRAVVLSRIGDNQADSYAWNLSSDKIASFYPKPIPFLKEMMSSNKYVAQLTPYNESPITAIFDTTGMENAIKPLRETCGW